MVDANWRANLSLDFGGWPLMSLLHDPFPEEKEIADRLYVSRTNFDGAIARTEPEACTVFEEGFEELFLIGSHVGMVDVFMQPQKGRHAVIFDILASPEEHSNYSVDLPVLKVSDDQGKYGRVMMDAVQAGIRHHMGLCNFVRKDWRELAKFLESESTLDLLLNAKTNRRKVGTAVLKQYEKCAEMHADYVGELVQRYAPQERGTVLGFIPVSCASEGVVVGDYIAPVASMESYLMKKK